MQFKAIQRLQKYGFSSYTAVIQKLVVKGFPEEKTKQALDTFEKLGFSQNHVSRILNCRRSSSLCENQPNDIIQCSQYLQSRLGYNDKQIRHILYNYPWILGQKNVDTENKLKLLEQKYNFTSQDISTIIYQYPRVLENMENNLKSIGQLMHDYVQFNEQDIGRILKHSPFLLQIDINRIKANLKLLYYLGFTTKQIQTLLYYSAEFMETKTKHLHTLWNFYKKLIKDDKVQAQLLADNPKLLHLEPKLMIGTKVNILKKEGLDIPQIGQILQVQPILFLKSVDSLQQKLKLFEKHFQSKLVQAPCFPKIIEFDYWRVIRPRLLNISDHNELLQACNMSEEEFVQKYNCKEKYDEYIAQIPPKISKEVDFGRRHFHKVFPKMVLLS